MQGVGVICFAASYALALILEISRLLFRSGIRGAFMLVFAGAGLFAHTIFLYYRAIDASGSPLASSQAWYFVAAWAVVAAYLYLTYFHPRTAFGVFLLPLALGLIAAGRFLANSTPIDARPAATTWGMIHGLSILATTVAVAVGFTTGVMYLRQAGRLKRKILPTGNLRLPSLEWLQRANGRAIVISLLTLALGILSGAILNRIKYGTEAADAVPWYDPVVLSTILMFVWMVVAAGVSIFYKPAREGHKVAYLTVLSFLFLIIALGCGLLLESRHWGTNEPTATSFLRQSASSPLIDTVWHVPEERRAWLVGDNHALRSSGTCHTRQVPRFQRAANSLKSGGTA